MIAAKIDDKLRIWCLYCVPAKPIDGYFIHHIQNRHPRQYKEDYLEVTE